MMPSKIKVVCVDDEPDLLEIISGPVRDCDFEPVCFSNGAEAIHYIRENAEFITLVISDVVMPKLDGFALRKAMLPDHKAIPFVLASGKVTRDEALLALENKISAFIEKPYNLGHLKELITKETKDRVASILEEVELREGFVTEALALVEEMEGLILDLENNEDVVPSINRIFACAHTIKGTSGFFSPDTIHRFTHRYEDFLSKYKLDPSQLNAAAISVLLKGLDVIKRLVGELRDRKKTDHKIDDLVEVFKLETQASVPVGEKVPAPAAVNKVNPEAPQHGSKSEEIRVGVDLLNHFMESSGELTVLRNMVNKSFRAIEAEYPGNSSVAALSDLLSEMHKVNASIQDQIVDLRKVSLKQVFRPLTRAVRDLCVGLKKKIRLTFNGDELRVDHSIADALSKCLIHIVRNAADHGIEGAEVRQKLGKPPEGQIYLGAEIVSEEVVITIKDDGRGIDPTKIRSKALESGFRTREQLAEMTEDEIRMLIFEPGFSTAEKVTDISGRGVGTDMVKGTVQSLGGVISLRSQINQGSEFILRLPIPKSVLIVSSLIVRISGRLFAIPQDQVIRVHHVNQGSQNDKIAHIGGATFLKEPHRLVPIAFGGELFGLGGQESGAADQIFIQVSSHDGAGDFCLGVEEVLGIEDTVVRKVGAWFQKISEFVGVTFLGDGGIGLILDTNGIGRRLQLVEQPERLGASKTESSSGASTEGDLVLLLKMPLRTQYGVKQEEIFRLEVFSSQDLQFSGKFPVVQYRSQVMPILDLSRVLGDEEMTEKEVLARETLPDRFPVLVAEFDGHFRGFRVDEIHDFAPCQETNTEGLFFCQGKTVKIVSLKSLMADI